MKSWRCKVALCTLHWQTTPCNGSMLNASWRQRRTNSKWLKSLRSSSSKFSWQPANFLSHTLMNGMNIDEMTRNVCAVSYVSSQLRGAIRWSRHTKLLFFAEKLGWPQYATMSPAWSPACHCEDLPSCKVVKDFDFPTPSQTKEIGLNLEGHHEGHHVEKNVDQRCHSIWIEHGLAMYVEYLPAD